MLFNPISDLTEHQKTYRVKICGLTDLGDAEIAIEYGADALGFVFAESPRKIDINTAKTIMRKLPNTVDKVALVVNSPKDNIQKLLDYLPISLIQFHGDESSEFCNQFNFPYIKVIRVSQSTNINDHGKDIINKGAKAILLDKWHPQKYGGTGEVIDEELLRQKIPQPFILSGGLNCDNVEQIIKQYQPYAVDVSSGIEQHPGKKNHQKLKTFLSTVKHLTYQV